MDDHTIDGHLGAALDALVGATHLTKQVQWSGVSPQRDQMRDLLVFLAESTRMVDEAEARLGGRADEVRSPSGRPRPNLLGEVDNDPDAAMDAFVAHLRDLEADLRQHADEMGAGSEAALLRDVATGLATRLTDID